ncbi:MAG TPA: hypothetical protein VJV79_36645 [Polyangiaceae bacterium]|nr:hypothetical protein [Polyangiaceae bacterium]
MGGRHLGQSRARGLAGLVRVASAAGTVAALLVLPAAARAQSTAAPLVPIVTPVRGDDLFASRNGLTAASAFAPLRLTLTGGLFSQASAFSGCEARSDASGNSVNGFALQRYTFLRLTPQLVLHGFSLAGCAVDAGMGGGLTYSVPLRKSLWLVASAGWYGLPSPGGGTPALVSTAARVDVVKQLAWGRTLSVGLGTRSGAGVFNALHFGGSF